MGERQIDTGLAADSHSLIGIGHALRNLFIASLDSNFADSNAFQQEFGHSPPTYF